MVDLDRYRGCLFGLAVGDAVGTTVEFCPRGSFDEGRDMNGGGPFHLKKGQWTDDTSMALCLAESLIENGYDPHDQVVRYLKWYRECHFSSNGYCFDIGITTRRSLTTFERSDKNEEYYGSSGEYDSGNGSLMRLAPVPMFFFGQDSEKAEKVVNAIKMSGESSKTTHATTKAIDACKYFSSLLVGAFEGKTKEELLSEDYVDKHFHKDDLCQDIQNIAKGSFKVIAYEDLRASGYVVHSLEAALWAFHRTHSFKEGLLDAVNLGEDADTVGAIYGQIAGAFYGYENIPKDWREAVSLEPVIKALADRLCHPNGTEEEERYQVLMKALRFLEENLSPKRTSSDLIRDDFEKKLQHWRDETTHSKQHDTDITQLVNEFHSRSR